MVHCNGLRRVAASTLVALAFLIASAVSPAWAQQTVNNYVVTTPSLTWNDISGTGTAIYNEVFRYYEGSLTTSLPFNFKYDGGTINAGTTIYITNARISLGADISYGYTDGGLGDQNLKNVLYPWGVPYCQMGDHAWATGYAEQYGIFEQTTGSVGSRVYTIQMTGVHTGWGSLWSGPTCISSMQVKLYEANGNIQFLYQNHDNYMAGSYTASIGINGGSNFTFKRAVQNTWYTPPTDLQFAPPVPPGEFSLQPKTLNYGGVSTGQSLTLTTRLTSLGPSPVKIISTTLAGSSDYTILNPVANGTTFAMGATYDFQIRFLPTSTGNRSATFTVVTDAADSATQVVVLNGSGLAPTVQYTFSGIYPHNSLFHRVSLRFGDSASQSFYVTSTGQVPLQFNSIQLFGLQADMYKVTHVPPNPLPAGVTDSITVQFKPYLEGRPDAQLVVSTNAFNLPYDTVTLWGSGKLGHLVVTPQTGKTGTGMTNGTLTFDSVGMGDSVCKTLALKNIGTDTLTITKQIVTYGDYDFTFYSLLPSELKIAPDQTRLVNVCFVPVAMGARMASIRFYTNISKTYPDQRDTSQFLIQVTGTGVPFGKLAVSGMRNADTLVGETKCLFDTIWNKGTADLMITKAMFSGSNASDFTLSGITLPKMLAAGGSQAVQICFTPEKRGLASASLDVTGTTSGRTLTQSLAITGNGQVVCMDASPNPVTFGSSSLPSMTMAKTGHDTTCITVTNCGDIPMSFTAMLSPSTSTNYMVTTASTPMIAAGATGTICVAYSPDTIGASSGGVVITPSEGSLTAVTLPLSGIGAGVVVAASGQPASTAVGSTSTFTVTLTNNGNMPWTPGAPTITTGDFSTTASVSSAQILPGQSATLAIDFKPTQGGTRTGQLSFASESPVAFSGLPYDLNGTASTSGVAMNTEQDGFALGASYPNPAAGAVSMIVTTPRDAKVTLTLVRIDGSQVATVFDGDLNTGEHVITFNASDLASGTYFYVLESGNVRLARQISVTH